VPDIAEIAIHPRDQWLILAGKVDVNLKPVS